MKYKILTILIIIFVSPLLLAMKGPNLRSFTEDENVNKKSIGVIHVANENSVKKIENNEVEFSSRIGTCFLVNQNTIVTAAHILNHFTKQNINHSRTYCEFETETGKSLILIKDILTHPQYHSDNVDLALVYLVKPCPQLRYLALEEENLYDASSNVETLTVGLNKKESYPYTNLDSIVYARLHYYAISSSSTSAMPMPPNFFLASQYILPKHSDIFLKEKDSFSFKAHGSFFVGDTCHTEPMDSGGPIINPINGKVIGISIKGLTTPYKVVNNTIYVKDQIQEWNKLEGEIFESHKAIGLFLLPYKEWIIKNIYYNENE